MRTRLTICLLAILAVIFAPAASAALVTAYEIPAGELGSQAFTGSLGMDFDVLSPISIFDLGVFDDNGDGISGTLSVAVFDRNTTSMVGSQLDFTNASQGTLVGGSRFKALGSPLDLAIGNYSIVAWGFGASDQNGNDGLVALSGLYNLNSNGGLISFVGDSRWDNTPGIFPGTVDGGPAARYYAGTFTFDAQVPEPSTYVLVGIGLVGLAVLRRRAGAR